MSVCLKAHTLQVLQLSCLYPEAVLSFSLTVYPEANPYNMHSVFTERQLQIRLVLLGPRREFTAKLDSGKCNELF